MTQKRIRISLPEDKNWRDTGCEVSPTCLACHLPVCRYDNSWVARKALAEVKA